MQKLIPTTDLRMIPNIFGRLCTTSIHQYVDLNINSLNQRLVSYVHPLAVGLKMYVFDVFIEVVLVFEPPGANMAGESTNLP